MEINYTNSLKYFETISTCINVIFLLTKKIQRGKVNPSGFLVQYLNSMLILKI